MRHGVRLWRRGLCTLGCFVLVALLAFGMACGVWGQWHAEDVVALPPAPSESAKTPTERHPGVAYDVQNIAQLPELRNGCEATALTILLQYYGCPADKEDVAYNYLPSVPFEYDEFGRYGPHPEDAYPGDPGGMAGYYCFEGPVIQAANTLLAEYELPHRAVQRDDLGEGGLLRLLDEEGPLLVWQTTDGRPLHTEPDYAWRLSGTEEVYEPYMNCHAMVVTGYNDGYFFVCDPLQKHTMVPREDFMDGFRWAGRRCVVLEPLQEA